MGKILLFFMTLACLSATGCGSRNLMQPADPAAVNGPVSPEETTIVFYRGIDTAITPRLFIPIIGPLITIKVASIMEISIDGQLSHVAYLIPGNKYQHRTTPGKHLYVVEGNPSKTLEADMEAGKTYYVGIDQISGLNTRFEFELVADPVNDLPTNFDSDNWYMWTENTPRGTRWFSKNKSSLQAKSIDALKSHNEAKPEEKKTIRPEYGIVTPIR